MIFALYPIVQKSPIRIFYPSKFEEAVLLIGMSGAFHAVDLGLNLSRGENIYNLTFFLLVSNSDPMVRGWYPVGINHTW